MARRSTKTPPPDDSYEERILDIDVVDEMQGSFLEYAYSVIYSRALPDARDGLKPVHRRIVYQMNEMGLRPDRGYVKCARVVGEVMGKLHPHGDASIYDALVRMAQPFSMRVPLVDGHGNFGSLGNDDPPAAMRYTECRMAEATSLMTESIEEDTVDFGPNYDGQEQEPVALPAAFPNLLVNGASGIAVGMATNMPPHNLREVIAAARHLIRYPNADLDALMKHVPGPDLPTGGRIVGLSGIRDAYASGRGTFKIRATVEIDTVTARRKGLVVTELPFAVGPEKVISKIKDLVGAKKIQGIADVKDLTDREHGLRLVIEIKNGFVPEAVLEQLYKLTAMEESFGINNVALVDGQPLTLGLKELLEVYLDHRFDVVRRRSEFRRGKRRDRLHLVEGLLTALVDIDEVIRLIRSSENSAQAKERLIERFALSDVQTQYILDTPLRRLTKFDRIELESEKERLNAEIAELTRILDSDTELRKLVSAELAAVSKKFGTDRRTVLLESSGAPAAVPLQVADDPCRVLLSSTGLLARTADANPFADDGKGRRVKHDLIVSAVPATARGEVGVVTSAGRLLRVNVVDLPQLPEQTGTPNLSGGAPLAEFVSLDADETVVCLTTLDESSPAWRSAPNRGSSSEWCPTTPPTRRSWRSSPSRRATGSSAPPNCAPARRTWSSSRTTPSSCATRPPRCARRAARPAAWRASSSPRGPRSSPSRRWIRPPTRWSSRSPDRAARWTTPCRRRPRPHRSISTRARGGRRAACAASGSSRARTACPSPGRVRPRRGRPRRTGRRPNCRRSTRAATARGCPWRRR